MSQTFAELERQLEAERARLALVVADTNRHVAEMEARANRLLEERTGTYYDNAQAIWEENKALSDEVARLKRELAARPGLAKGKKTAVKRKKKGHGVARTGRAEVEEF